MSDEKFESIDDGSFEVLEFTVGNNSYGINIAKAKEIIQYQPATPSPDQDPCVEGILLLRSAPIPILDLSKRLATEPTTNVERDLYIISAFNSITVGLHVHSIIGIHKMNWSQIRKPDETITRHGNSIVTGIINFKDHFVMLLDFEKIVADINPVTTIQVADVPINTSPNQNPAPILIAEDSVMLNHLVCSALDKAGYENVVATADGEEAWNYLQSQKSNPGITPAIRCVITDIEMPIMDGLTLTRKIKADPAFTDLPVLIFSSIVDEATHQKGLDSGADAVLAKPNIGQLAEVLRGILS